MNEWDFAKKHNGNIVLGLGFFDCVHKGHRKIIEAVISLAEKYSCLPAISTYKNNLYANFDKTAKLVYTYEERKVLFEDAGINTVISCIFDKQFASISADAFLERLFENFSIRAVVCGYDFTYGKEKNGVSELISACKNRGIELCVIDEYALCGVRVSTTQIKNLLADREIAKANELLERDFFLSGKVIKGRGIGSTIGFPTANVEISPDKLLPKGVFAGYATVDYVEYPAIINIGPQPTFHLENTTVEVYLAGYNGDLYGKLLSVHLLRFLRDTQRFENQAQLINQLKEDADNACIIWSKR